MSKNNEVEFIFLKESVKRFNEDLSKFQKHFDNFSCNQRNVLVANLEAVKENIELIGKEFLEK